MNFGCQMSESEPIRVSVAVPCRNEGRHISRFLDCLFRQQLNGIDLEVLIADGRSDDDTREVLDHVLCKNAAGLPVKVIDNPGRIVSTGLNAAIRAARGEVIIRMDAHTEYASDYIQSCVRVLRKRAPITSAARGRPKAVGSSGPQSPLLSAHSSASVADGPTIPCMKVR